MTDERFNLEKRKTLSDLTKFIISLFVYIVLFMGAIAFVANSYTNRPSTCESTCAPFKFDQTINSCSCTGELK